MSRRSPSVSAALAGLKPRPAAASLAALGLGHRAVVVEGRFADTLDGVLAELSPMA